MICEKEVSKFLFKILKDKSIIIFNINSSKTAKFFSTILIKSLNDSQENKLKNLINSQVYVKNFDIYSKEVIQDDKEFIRYIESERIEIAAIDQEFLITKSSTKENFRNESTENILSIFSKFENKKMSNQLQHILFIQHMKSSCEKIESKMGNIKKVPVWSISINPDEIVFDNLSLKEKITINKAVEV